MEQWRKSFIIDNFGRNYGALYVLKILNRKPAPNTYHNDHLGIFCS